MESPADNSVKEAIAVSSFLSQLSDAQKDWLASQARLIPFKLGSRLLGSDEKVQGLYLVVKGRVRLVDDRGDKEQSLDTRKTGAVFGELSILREQHSEYSVRASSTGTLALFPAAAFEPIFKENPKAREFMASMAAINTLGGLVGQLFDLRGRLDADAMAELVASVGIKNLPANSTILEQGSTADRRLYVIRQGEASVRVAKSEDTDPSDTQSEDYFELARLKAGEIFGEKACLLRQAQMASVVATRDVTLFVLPENTVRQIVEANPKLKTVIEERIAFLDKELARQQRLQALSAPKAQVDLATQPKRGEQVIKRFPLIQQAEEMDCGAACLAMICQQAGLKLSVGKLRDMIGVTREGANLENIARVAENLGFHTRGLETTFNGLKDLKLPFIAHWEGYHFVVVYGLSDEHVWVADPGPGFRKLTVDEFNRSWSGTCLTLTPGELAQEQATGQSPWSRFFTYVRPHRKTVGHLFVAALVIQLLGLLPPVITQNVLDRVVVHENLHLLNVLIIALVLSQVFAQVSTAVRNYLSQHMTRSIDFAMMSHFFKHTLALPVAFFANRRAGDIIARFQENQTIRQFLTTQVSGTILNTIMVVVYLSVMFLYNVKLTLILLAFIIPLFLLVFFITPKMKQYSRETFNSSTEAEAVLMEAVSLAESVKGMGIEREVRLKWEKKYLDALNVQYQAQGFQTLVGFASQLLNIGGTVAVLYLGATMVIDQEFSVGQLVAFNMLATSVMGPLMALVGVWDEMHSALVAMERLGDVLDVPPEQDAKSLSQQVVLPEMAGDFRFENVYFRYHENSPYILQNVSLDIKPGQMVALVGLSGSGKSTLTKLLMGFYPVSEGKLTVDGYDMNAIEKQSYRAQIGYVMQANLLFKGTIEENIAAGDPDPDRRRVMEVAQLADAHDFISQLPLGYQQAVGERGVGLSGGQIQRLCIARALYRDPKVLILDEATSSLDAQSESNILSNMDSIVEGRTTLVIAHRLSTIMRADQILVLYNGSIVEQGTHDTLLAAGGMYEQLVTKQIAPADKS